MRFAIVGQAPAKSTVGRAPLTSGATTRRLFKLMGVTKIEYKALFLRANLLASYMGPALGGGDAFPAGPAGVAAARLLSRLPPSCGVVALGRGVASALGFPGDVDFFRWFDFDGRRCAVSPHPSGKSRWWNTKWNRRRAREFFRGLAKAARLRSTREGTP